MIKQPPKSFTPIWDPFLPIRPQFEVITIHNTFCEVKQTGKEKTLTSFGFIFLSSPSLVGVRKLKKHLKLSTKCSLACYYR